MKKKIHFIWYMAVFSLLLLGAGVFGIYMSVKSLLPIFELDQGQKQIIFLGKTYPLDKIEAEIVSSNTEQALNITPAQKLSIELEDYKVSLVTISEATNEVKYSCERMNPPQGDTAVFFDGEVVVRLVGSGECEFQIPQSIAFDLKMVKGDMHWRKSKQSSFKALLTVQGGKIEGDLSSLNRDESTPITIAIQQGNLVIENH